MNLAKGKIDLDKEHNTYCCRSIILVVNNVSNLTVFINLKCVCPLEIIEIRLRFTSMGKLKVKNIVKGT